MIIYVGVKFTLLGSLLIAFANLTGEFTFDIQSIGLNIGTYKGMRGTDFYIMFIKGKKLVLR